MRVRSLIVLLAATLVMPASALAQGQAPQPASEFQTA